MNLMTKKRNKDNMKEFKEKIIFNKTISDINKLKKNRTIMKKNNKKDKFSSPNKLNKKKKLCSVSISKRKKSFSINKKNNIFEEWADYNNKIIKELKILELSKIKINNFLNIDLNEIIKKISVNIEEERNYISNKWINLKNYQNLLYEFNSNFDTKTIEKNTKIKVELMNLFDLINLELKKEINNFDCILNNIFFKKFKQKLFDKVSIQNKIKKIKEKNKTEIKNINDLFNKEKNKLNNLLIKIVENTDNFQKICKEMINPSNNDETEDVENTINIIKNKFDNYSKSYFLLKNEIFNMTFKKNDSNENDTNKDKNWLNYNFNKFLKSKFDKKEDKIKTNNVYLNNKIIDEILKNQIKKINS